MVARVIRVLRGNATKADILKLMLAFFGSTTALLFAAAAAVTVLLLVVMMGTNNTSITSANVSTEALAWQSTIADEVEKNDLPPEAVSYILAIMQAESGGNAERYPDVMQASESRGDAPNTIQDPYESIEVGVAYFASLYKNNPEMDLLNIVQAYNYGGGFLNFADTSYSLDTAIEFANQRAKGGTVKYTNPIAIANGYDWRYKYGNMFYALVVKSYLVTEKVDGGGSNNDLAAGAIAELKTGSNKGGGKYWSWYGFGYRVEWCATFVSYVAAHNNVEMEKFAYVPYGINTFKSKNQFKRAGVVPEAGWLIFFDWQGDGVSDHVGIVKEVIGDEVITIEGNTSDMVAERRYSVKSSVISGYANP